MSVEVCFMNAQLEIDYERFLNVAPAALFNHSLKYRDFLSRVTNNSESQYLLAYVDGELVGALPAFMQQGPYGAVINSLPFFGSHGGILTNEDVNDSVIHALLSAYERLCIDNKAFTSTIVESPICRNEILLGKYKADFTDDRIGQITTLPARASMELVTEKLLEKFHKKTRNMVRKGLKGGFDISHSGSLETFQKLHMLHKNDMERMGRLAKDENVFNAIHSIFNYDQDYRIYTAKLDGEVVSALLLFYFKDTVEYFTPVTKEEYRSHQPLSALIFTAMTEAVVEKNSRLWNWGGTWLSQESVYQFKSRWGTIDHPYKYNVKVYRNGFNLEDYSAEKLLKEYPYFYTIPFSFLSKD